jgi:hypothetical protein
LEVKDIIPNTKNDKNKRGKMVDFFMAGTELQKYKKTFIKLKTKVLFFKQLEEYYLQLKNMPSSVIKSYFYDEDKKILRIVYQSGAVYDYLNLSQTVFDDFKSAFSKGTFLNKVIKPKFQFRKISD